MSKTKPIVFPDKLLPLCFFPILSAQARNTGVSLRAFLSHSPANLSNSQVLEPSSSQLWPPPSHWHCPSSPFVTCIHPIHTSSSSLTSICTALRHSAHCSLTDLTWRCVIKVIFIAPWGLEFKLLSIKNKILDPCYVLSFISSSSPNLLVHFMLQWHQIICSSLNLLCSLSWNTLHLANSQLFFKSKIKWCLPRAPSSFPWISQADFYT